MSLRLLAAAAAAALPLAVAAQEPTFKSGTEVVPLHVTVTDEEKRLVPNLVKDVFEVFDEGKPVTVTLFENEPQPFSVVVMLDTSASMTASLDLLKAAAEQFLIRLLPEDRGMIGAFNDKIQFPIGEFVSDRDELIAAVGELGFGNPTRLYDAIDASLDQLSGVAGRRVVLVFTDGEDTASSIGRGDVQDRARDEEVMIYAIGLESVYFNGVQRVRSRPDGGLKRLAEETGGGYFELKKTDELGATFTRVAQELHSQYVLGFAPATDGKVHEVEVKIKAPGLTARARKSYLAPGGGTQ